MKPASIRKFDWLFWASIIVGLGALAIGWDVVEAQVMAELAGSGDEQIGGTIVAVVIAIGALTMVALGLAIWSAISIWRVEFVKWVVVALVAYSLWTLPQAIMTEDGLLVANLVSLISTALTAAAAWFLFQPDAKAWFDAKRGPETGD